MKIFNRPNMLSIFKGYFFALSAFRPYRRSGLDNDMAM